MTTRSSASTFRLCVEGNIGSGKTTLLKRLDLDDSLTVVPEPVEEWEKRGFLRRLYDGTMTVLAFQFIVLCDLVKGWSDVESESDDGRTPIHERTVWSTQYVFAKANLTHEDASAFSYAWKKMVEGLPLPDAIVYLRASPQTCMRRISSRARRSESSISTEYLESLHEAHEAWLGRSATTSDGVPVYIVNAEDDETVVHDMVVSLLKDLHASKTVLARS